MEATMTEYAIQEDARAGMLDALGSVDQMEASILAFRAQMVASIVSHAELTDQSEFRDRSMCAEIAATLRIPEVSASRLITTSRTLVAELPATMEALESGRISWRHVEKLVEHANTLPAEARAAFEAAVLPAAEAFTVAQFNKQARRVREKMHPDSITERREAAVAHRSVGIEPGLDGMSWLTAHLPAEQAEAIDNRLDDIARSMRTAEETRTLPQLRTDAFVDLLVNADPKKGTGRKGIVAQVMVTVPAFTLMGIGNEPGILDGYGPISPDVARALCANAPSFYRLLTSPVSGAVLKLDPQKYRPSKALQRWLRFRDGVCRFPGCGRKARTAHIDHTLDWLYGGTTDPENLECLCEAHHRLKHNSAWTVTQLGGGVLRWISPAGKEFITRPDINLPPPAD
jgi:Domain of unknown function (DUF222)/HNH endonuclease